MATSRVVKNLPVDAKLPDGRTNGSQFQVTATPVRNYGSGLSIWVEPFAVRAAASSCQFVATQCRQLSRYFSILHGAVTKVSTHTGPLASGTIAFCGRLRPR